MRRREFITLLGGAATAWPLAARAQQGERLRRVGVLTGIAEEDVQAQPQLATFNRALQELGWIDGRNLQIDHRFGAADVDRMQRFAKELVSFQPDVIVGATTPVVAALARETKTIPIVFVVVSDPVGSGFVSSFSRPRGNITGFVNIEASMAGKWIDFLKEVSPRLARVAFIYNPATAPYSFYLDPFKTAAKSIGVEALPTPIQAVEEIEPAIGRLSENPNSSLAVMPDIFTARLPVYKQIISLATRYRIPAVYPYRFMAAAGGLLSYGTDNSDLYRRAASYVDRILKGAKPAELPVQLPTKFEFVLNMRTAQALDLDIPLKLRVFADEVIE